MRLYSYWRSTTSYRVRIALNLKGLDHQIAPVDLLAGAQTSPDYVALNPGKGVPTLVLDDGTVLTQSLAILDWLDAAHPEPPLLPAEPLARARVLAAAHSVALDIHPVNNLRVAKYLERLGHSREDVTNWMRHWMHEGLTAFQTLIRDDTAFSFGDRPDLADICVVAQLYNGRRWGLDLAPFARIVEIETNCLKLAAFDRARPENQPDAS